MAAGPLDPAVNSVNRVVSVAVSCVAPAAVKIHARVPAGTSTTARRVPSASVLNDPNAACMLVEGIVNTVVFGSSASITTSSTWTKSCQGTSRVRWTGR